MNSMIDLRVLELTCSRLCHDLISPITAVNNGMELLADSPAEIIDEIKGLLSTSAGEASRRLQFYRIAFGLGGQDAAPIGLDEAGRLAHGLVDGGKIELAWPNGNSVGEIGKPGTKVLLNTLLIGLDALPRGGKASVQVDATTDLRVKVVAEGQGARITEECEAAMSTEADADALTARSVQAYLTRQLVSALGGSIEVDRSEPDKIAIEATVPA